jgi:hypothetical protein
MPKSTKARIRDGMKEYREIGGVVGGLECALALLEDGDRDDPKLFCAISALTMVIPVMEAAKAAHDDDGIDNEEFWE